MGRAPARVAAWLGLVACVTAGASAAALAPRGGTESPCWVRGDPARLSGRRSPRDSVTAPLGAATVKVCYSRPSARGRTIMGGLVRYGVPWRLGADEATTLSTPVAVRFGDLALAAGRYSLYAVPAATQWEIVVNASAERWGVPIGAPVRARDVGSVTVAPDSTDRPVEQLVLRLEPGPAGGLVLVAEWERTRIRVPIELQ